jgi:hypothetical protein
MVHAFIVASFPPAGDVTAWSNEPPPDTDQLSVRLV